MYNFLHKFFVHGALYRSRLSLKWAQYLAWDILHIQLHAATIGDDMLQGVGAPDGVRYMQCHKKW